MGIPRHAPRDSKGKGHSRQEGNGPGWEEHARIVASRGKDKRTAEARQGPTTEGASAAWKRAVAATAGRRSKGSRKTSG